MYIPCSQERVLTLDTGEEYEADGVGVCRGELTQAGDT